MPHELDPTVAKQKNKLFTDKAWLLLYEFEVEGGAAILRLVANRTGVTFDSNFYHPSAVELQLIQETTDGAPVVSLAIDNTLREIEALLEHHDGLKNERARVYVITEQAMDSPSMARVFNFRVSSVTADEKSANITLSAHTLLTEGWPHRRWGRITCRAGFKSEECGWGFGGLPQGVQDSPSCDHTRDGVNGCAFHGSLYTAAGEPSLWPQRFNAEPLIPKKRGP